MDVEIVLDESDLSYVWRVETVFRASVLRVGFRPGGKAAVLVSGGRGDIVAIQALLDPFGERGITVRPHSEPHWSSRERFVMPEALAG